MRLVVVETPFAGDVELHLKYLRACLRNCLLNGEAPFASHGLYTQPGVLDDDVLGDRQLGMEAGFAWRRVADATVVYTDLGVTPGMQAGMNHAKDVGCPIWMRSLGPNWDKAPVEDDDLLDDEFGYQKDDY